MLKKLKEWDERIVLYFRKRNLEKKRQALADRRIKYLHIPLYVTRDIQVDDYTTDGGGTHIPTLRTVDRVQESNFENRGLALSADNDEGYRLGFLEIDVLPIKQRIEHLKELLLWHEAEMDERYTHDKIRTKEKISRLRTSIRRLESNPSPSL